jgi:hypothetical protein
MTNCINPEQYFYGINTIYSFSKDKVAEEKIKQFVEKHRDKLKEAGVLEETNYCIKKKRTMPVILIRIIEEINSDKANPVFTVRKENIWKYPVDENLTNQLQGVKLSNKYYANRTELSRFSSGRSQTYSYKTGNRFNNRISETNPGVRPFDMQGTLKKAMKNEPLPQPNEYKSIISLLKEARTKKRKDAPEQTPTGQPKVKKPRTTKSDSSSDEATSPAETPQLSQPETPSTNVAIQMPEKLQITKSDSSSENPSTNFPTLSSQSYAATAGFDKDFDKEWNAIWQDQDHVDINSIDELDIVDNLPRSHFLIEPNTIAAQQLLLDYSI